MAKRSKSIAAKKSKAKAAANSYSHLMGSPMDVADHPVNNVPSPQGGSFNGAQLMAPGAPMVPGEPI